MGSFRPSPLGTAAELDETDDPRELAKRAAQAALWRRGDLKWKLKKHQKEIYERIHSAKKRRYLLLCSRRIGKSYTLVCLALEYALKNPGSRISYAAATQKDAAEIATDIAAQILSDCPKDVKPVYLAQPKELRFKNGSLIRFSGVNNGHHENLRGRAAHLFILDEAATMDELDYLLKSIVGPMTMTTQGRILLASTPAKSPGHEFTKIAQDMIAKELASVYTLLDAPSDHLSEAVKAEYLEDAGEAAEDIPFILRREIQPKTTTALREYFCRMDVTDAESAVVPEFDGKAREECVKEWERPPYFDGYVSMDPGFNDRTGVLFGWADFQNHKLIIEGELLLARANTDDIAAAVRNMERTLWDSQAPLVRISDIDLRLIADLYTRHGLVFTPAQKQDSMGAIDLMRSMIRRREIIISPRCTQLVRQLGDATWNKKATDFERTKEHAHYDLVAALKYMCRSVVWTRNPYPAWYNRPEFGTYESRFAGAKKNKSVFSNTPFGRKLAKKHG